MTGERRPIVREPLRVAVATGNFGRGKPADVFEENLQRVVDALNEQSPFWLLGCQEIDEADTPDEHAIIRRTLPRAHLVGFDTHTPIIASPRTRPVHERVTRGSTGVPRATPARQVVEGVFEFAEYDDHQLAMVNTHMPLDKPRLQSRRRRVKRVLKRRIRRMRKLGHDVVWSGDMNELGLNALGPAERRLVNARRDYLGLFPAWGRKRSSWRVADREVVDLTIDGHNAHIVVLELVEHGKE